MEKEIIIPVFKEKTVKDDSSGIDPSTVKEKVKKTLESALKEITIDKESLHKCISSVETLIANTSNSIKKLDTILLDNLSIQFGISTTGKVGLFGSGIDIGLAGTFQLTFKINTKPEPQHKEDYI
jgi:hypothetical protein